jgi:hypothetical protein
MSQINDYRELIPEFFFTSAFLQNRDHFDLGVVNDISISDVVLPPWSKTALEFIYIHRKALESDFVSNNLPFWIDLVWGYKQVGQASVDAYNTYDPLLYETVWETPGGKDKEKRPIFEAILQNCGHLAPKLFSSPHPLRSIAPTEILLRSAHPIPLLGHQIMFACISPPHFRISCITDKQELLEASISIPDNTCTISATTPLNIPLSLGRIGVLNDHSLLFALTLSGRFVKVNARTGEHHFLSGHIGKVNCISSSEDWLATGGADTTLNIWEIADTSAPVHSVTTCRDEVVCCACGQTFGIVAGATRDGSVFIPVITTRAVSRVLVTPGWGCVLVHSGKFVNAVSGRALGRARGGAAPRGARGARVAGARTTNARSRRWLNSAGPRRRRRRAQTSTD